MTLAKVKLWGRVIGAVSLNPDQDVAAFQYDPDFARSNIQVSPIKMPLSDRIYQFPELPHPTFHGLPGLLADVLPDKFGNALINAWLASQGRAPESLNAVERLCYLGTRGMGALEFHPATGPKSTKAEAINVDALVRLASDVLTRRDQLSTSFSRTAKVKALGDILRVGTSAGGARAKAVIAWNPKTNEVRSGQSQRDEGFQHWLLKFDGVSGNKDREIDTEKGFGAIEFAYSLMAQVAGIKMSECRILEEKGRRHFMTQRFDRTPSGGKLHMQSLGSLAHFDFNQAGAHSYEQALMVIRQLDMPMEAVEEQFRRMTFNIVARNQDDHVKNIAFLMDREGRWSLSPAFDVNYSYDPSGQWTSAHQMTMNGKRDGFSIEDFRQCAKVAHLKRGRPEEILKEVMAATTRWSDFSSTAGVPPASRDEISKNFRLSF